MTGVYLGGRGTRIRGQAAGKSVEIAPNTFGGELWALPENPSEYDQEFNGGPGLPAGWSAIGDNIIGAPQLAAGFTTQDAHRLDVNAYRKSCAVIQASNDFAGRVRNDGGIFVDLGAEVPDGFWWTRCGGLTKFGASNTENDGNVVFAMASLDGSSEPDAAYGPRLAATDVDGPADNDIETAYAMFTGDPQPTQAIATTMSNWEGRSNALEYFGIRKTGNVYEAFAAGDAGGWIYISTRTYGEIPVIRSIWLNVEIKTTTGPGNIAAWFDFLRYRADGELP